MIRQATRADFPTFLRLWLDFLQDQQEQGGDMLSTPKTISFFTLLFSAYVTGVRKGIVLLHEDCGVMLWGEGLADLPYDTQNDLCANGWGVFVSPEFRRKGISRALYQHGSKMLREMGFSTMFAGASLKNKAGQANLISEGFRFSQIGGVLRINTSKEYSSPKEK